MWHHAPPFIVGKMPQDSIIIIRSFRNADLPFLLELWVQHWSRIGPPPNVDAARLEQAVLARTFFDPENLLVAETDDGVQAWCHFAHSTGSKDTAVICAISFGASDDSLVSELLSAAEQRIVESGYKRVEVGLVRDDAQGYGGIDPIGHGIGIPAADLRTNLLLEKANFVPRDSVIRLTAAVAGYRSPVSREALQFRRSSRIESDAFSHADVRHASAMSHLDVEVIRLLDPMGQESARLHLWFSDAEAEVMDPSLAILDLADTHLRGRLESPESFLIGAAVQSLTERRIATVETAIDTDQTELIAQLEKLQFQKKDEGVRWEKSLS